MVRAATACTFSTSQLPKVVRRWFVLYILTSKCASRYNRGATFHLSSGQLAPHSPLLRAYFSTFGATNHWKNEVNRDFLTFSRTCIFFILTFSPLFSSLTLPTSAFPTVHIVGSFTSKLPSIIRSAFPGNNHVVYVSFYVHILSYIENLYTEHVYVQSIHTHIYIYTYYVYITESNMYTVYIYTYIVDM